MQIFIHRNDQKHGPYSLNDVNTYLNTGQLHPTDLACYEGQDHWSSLSTFEGVVVPEKLPPPPINSAPTIVIQSSGVKDERSGLMELVSFLFPILGFIFWAIYINNQPNRAKHIGFAALVSVGATILVWLVYVASSN